MSCANRSLDDDGGGELSIDEIVDFIVHGSETFTQDMKPKSTSNDSPSENAAMASARTKEKEDDTTAILKRGSAGILVLIPY